MECLPPHPGYFAAWNRGGVEPQRGGGRHEPWVLLLAG